ncbi:MAG: hypothetical protein IKR92_00145 [Alphaproteobacteria bacterium]|nr:hypothetical protein [Alphaproteobacteria bacterium]
MAKNFKNNGVSAVCASVFCFVWDNAIRWIIAGAICLIWSLVCIALIIISPLWVTVWTLRDPDSCARHLNMSNDYVKGWVARYLKRCTWALCHSSLWVNTPFIALLPMRYRAEFIRWGKKRVCEYSPKKQIAYYKSHDDESKQSLLSSGVFSPEVRATLWFDETERENWLACGVELSRSQVADLCQKGSGKQLWRYFKQRTPSKEMYDLLLKYVREGYAAPAETLINLIRQQRPNAEIIGKLLCTQNDGFIKKVNEVIDSYADVDAVDFGTQSINGVSDEEKQRIIGERWTNFCKSKKDICRAAQKKMGHRQYQIFAETGHKLEYYALQHLCLSLAQGQRDYLKEIIANEFENIDSRLQTALKADYWRYSTYLEVEEERRNATKAA